MDLHHKSSRSSGKTKGISFLKTSIKFYVQLPEQQKTKSSNQQ